MGYTTSGGPKGLGAITSPFTPKADLTQLIALMAAVGNFRVGTTDDRDDLTGGALYEGVLFYNTDTNTLEQYDGGWGALLKRKTSWTPTLTGFNVGNGTLRSEHLEVDGVVFFFIEFVAGTTSSASGTLSISLPSTPVSSVHKHVGGGLFRVTAGGGAGSAWPIEARIAGGSTLALTFSDASAATLALGTNASNTNPTATAWGTALPTFTLQGMYERT